MFIFYKYCLYISVFFKKHSRQLQVTKTLDYNRLRLEEAVFCCPLVPSSDSWKYKHFSFPAKCFRKFVQFGSQNKIMA